MEERENFLVLIDEEGHEEEFEYIDSIETEKGDYVVLLPYGDQEEEEEEIVILKVERDGDEESLVSVQDEDELNQVYEIFKTRVEDEFDFADEDN